MCHFTHLVCSKKDPRGKKYECEYSYRKNPSIQEEF